MCGKLGQKRLARGGRATTSRQADRATRRAELAPASAPARARQTAASRRSRSNSAANASRLARGCQASAIAICRVHVPAGLTHPPAMSDRGPDCKPSRGAGIARQLCVNHEAWRSAYPGSAMCCPERPFFPTRGQPDAGDLQLFQALAAQHQRQRAGHRSSGHARADRGRRASRSICRSGICGNRSCSTRSTRRRSLAPTRAPAARPRPSSRPRAQQEYSANLVADDGFRGHVPERYARRTGQPASATAWWLRRRRPSLFRSPAS